MANGSVTVKQLPSPTVLSTVIVPFIFCTSWFTMDIPSPVPPYWERAALSSWLNASNRWLSIKSCVMPMPVSRIVNA